MLADLTALIARARELGVALEEIARRTGVRRQTLTHWVGGREPRHMAVVLAAVHELRAIITAEEARLERVEQFRRERDRDRSDAA